MNKTIKLHNWLGEEVVFEVEDVEDIVSALQYEVSGDECLAIGYSDGTLITLDAGADTRQFSFGPENAEFLLPNAIPWEVGPHDA